MKNLFYITFGICYCLLFGELFVRLFNPVPLMPRYVTAAPYGVRMNVPNAQYWQTTPETKVQIRINAQGIRSAREYPYQKPDNKCRILLFGDSFLVGYEVTLKDSFAYLLERKLNANGYPCEVINFAVSGFGTAEMLVTLQNEGLKYQPDIVIFQWHSTDYKDNVRSSALFKNNADGQLVRTKATYLPAVRIRDWLSQFAIYRFLIENSQLYSAIRETAAKKIKSLLASFRKPRKSVSITSSKQPQRKNDFAKRLSIRLLQEAKRVSNKHNAYFCVLEIPYRRSRTKFKSKLSAFEPALREQLQMFSPAQTFSKAADPTIKIYFERGHFHLTPFGNQLLTKYFLSKLIALSWLK